MLSKMIAVVFIVVGFAGAVSAQETTQYIFPSNIRAEDNRYMQTAENMGRPEFLISGYIPEGNNGYFCTLARDQFYEQLREEIEKKGYDFARALESMVCELEVENGYRSVRVLHKITRQHGMPRITVRNIMDYLLKNNHEDIFVELVRAYDYQPNLLEEIYAASIFALNHNMIDRSDLYRRLGRHLCNRIKRYEIEGLEDIVAGCALEPFSYNMTNE